MTDRKNQLVRAVFTSLGLVTIDQLCKALALRVPDFSFYLINPWLGWEFFLNPGVAFGIPIPGQVMTMITPPIVIFLFWQLTKKYNEPKTLFSELCGLVLIIFGAASNLIDRMVINYTVDYLRLFYSVINLADIMIVCGLFFTLRANYQVDKTL